MIKLTKHTHEHKALKQMMYWTAFTLGGMLWRGASEEEIGLIVSTMGAAGAFGYDEKPKN